MRSSQSELGLPVISQAATIARKGNLVTAASPGDVRAPEMSYGEGSTLTTDFIKMAP